MKQRTLKNSISVEGVGLHTGKKVTLKMVPATCNTGIIFSRKDIDNCPLIKATVKNVLPPEDFPRRTSLRGPGGVIIHTVEHLMAAFSGAMIDNILVEIDGEEVPGLDGSGKKFLELIKKAGIEEQREEKNLFVVREPFFVNSDNSFIACFPHGSLKISYLLDYDHPLLKHQFIEVDMNPEVFEKDIATARTFCLEEEVESLRDLGLGKGADYKNTLVVSRDGVVNNKVYFDDEFARHKLLDLLGDLYLLGAIQGYIVAIRSGHSTNINFVRKLQKYKDESTKSGVAAKFTIDTPRSLNIQEIMEILPHRYPFLFVDKILHLEPGKKAVGLKNVTLNDYFFEGHFPGKPIMPGVLIIEAMAQTGGVLMLSLKENKGKLAFFMAADKVKFRKTVEPGDTIIMEVEAKKVKSRTGIVSARAFVDDKVVAEAELYFALSQS